MPTHHLTRKSDGVSVKREEEQICLFAQTNFRNQMRRFGIKLDDRRRHTYVIGKTGMGKTTLIENMILHDIYSGHGIGLVDPHGDSAEKIIDYIPSHRINDVIYVNPADVEFPIGFNILEVHNPEQKHLVAAGLMATFKKIWPDVWSSRMEYILNNTLLALLDYPGSTLLGINRMLGDKKFRKKVVRALTDPVVKSFWQNEFENYEPRYQKEAVAPIQNKIGQFLSANVIRNMVAQVKSSIEIRNAMDSNKILIMNLSKGRIGEDNCRLLGGMLITKIQISAMERVDMPESERKDFFLYVDEFQNFATPSFANILSEARKYRLSLIMAHQYVAQLDEIVADAVFGNVGTIITFRVGGADAEILVKEFTPTFLEEDIVNLAKYEIFLKLMIDGVASMPFSATTLPPIGLPTASAEKVIRVSRERYGKPREMIEDKILRWSGLEGLQDDDASGDLDDEDDVDTARDRFKEKRQDVGQKPKDSGMEKPKKEDRPKDEKQYGGKDDKKSNIREEQQTKTENRKQDAGPSKALQPHTVPLDTFPEELVKKSQEPQKEQSKEDTISLNDLLPKDSGRDLYEKKEEHVRQVEPEQNKSPESGQKHPEQKQPLQDRPQQNDSVADRQTSGNSEQKKKRKRKRKKKDGQAQGGSTFQTFQAVEEKSVEQPKKLDPDFKKTDSQPKKLDPDRIITFNDDDDAQGTKVTQKYEDDWDDGYRNDT